jgi:hypothetical protein
MSRVWRAGPGHDPFNSVWASPTRASCHAGAVASARSADSARHDYIFFILQKNRIYMYNLYSILKTIYHDVLLVRRLHLVSPALLPSGLGFEQEVVGSQEQLHCHHSADGMTF